LLSPDSRGHSPEEPENFCLVKIMALEKRDREEETESEIIDQGIFCIKSIDAVRLEKKSVYESQHVDQQ
jgi:hypothetical protein